MRATKLYTFVALGYAPFLGVSALQCQDPGTADSLEEVDSLRANIDAFCSKTNGFDNAVSGAIKMQVTPAGKDSGSPAAADCTEALNHIADNCFAIGYGEGTTETEGFTYMLAQSSTSNLEARAKKPKKKTTKKAKTPKTTKAKTTKTKPPKTTTTKPPKTSKAIPPKTSKAIPPKTSKIVPPTSKAASIKPTPTKSSSARLSSTRSSSVATPSATGASKCKRLGKNDKVGRNKNKREDGPRSPHAALLSRAPKKGKVCGKILESDSYSSSGKQPGNVATYGWTIADSCTDYRWGGWDATGDYDTEHIMEWQMVTSFFTTLDEKWGSKRWDHPDPKALDSNGNRKQIGFCELWREQWFDNPGQFSIGSSPAMTIKKHIAWEYPSDNRYPKEFVVLQTKINSPAKQALWQHDPNEPIYNDSDMQKLVDGSDEDIRIAVQRVRAVIGMYKYMVEPDIKKYFGEEVKRMGKQMGLIDSTLPSNPRQITRGDIRTYDPWQKLGLEAEWKSFADAKFVQAKKKADDFGKKWVKKLKDKKCSSTERAKVKPDPKDTQVQLQKKEEMKDIQFTVDKLEAEWKKVPSWTKPW